MSGYFERLEAHLRVAAETYAPARAPARSRRLLPRRGSRPLAVALAAVVLGGSAAAAAIKLSESTSRPLSGRLPGAFARSSSQARSLAGDSYRISVSPDLDAGDVGWCTSIVYYAHGRLYTAWGSCETGGGYPTPGSPLFSPSAGLGFPGRLARGDRVVFTLAGPRVAAVRIGTHTVRAASEPGLPRGDRAAVFYLPLSAPPASIPPVGVRYPYRFTLQDWRVGHPRRVRATPMLALDASGNVIRYDRQRRSRRALVRFWGGGATRSARLHGITPRPRPGVCELQAQGGHDTRAMFGRTLTRLFRVSDLEGQAFMSCAWTVYMVHGRLLQAAVLLDARRPGHALTQIPGAAPLAGHPGYVNDAVDEIDGGLTARREGDSWVVIQGHYGLGYRLALLEHLRGGLAR